MGVMNGKKLTPRSTEKEWQGVLVRSVEEIETRAATFPRGTLFKVLGKFGGLTLESQPCERCGIRLRARRVSFFKVEVV
jgi:hypothetical protein